MNFTKYFFIPPFILFLYTCASYGMDETLSPRKIQPELIFDLFNVEKGLKDNGTFVEKLLNSNIAISPDGNQLFIGTKGTVYSLDFPKNAYIPHKKLEYLMKHPDVIHPPILALAQKTKKKSIIVGSAGNFLKSKQWRSHLIVYNNKTKKYIHVKPFDYAIQALDFDDRAKILAIGTTQFIEIYNIKKNCSQQITFRPTISNKFLVDMAISKDGKHLIATAESDLLELLTIQDDTIPRQLNTVASLLEIESIQFPHRKVILAVTKQGLTFMISPYDMLKTNNIYDTTRASQAVQSCLGAIEAECDKVTLNSGWVIASAHWTSNGQVTDKKRHTIKVSVAQNQTPDEKTSLNSLGETEFILTAPAYEDTYTMMSNTGRLTTHNECFLAVSFCGEYLVALNSCGKIFLWKLPIGNLQTKNESEEDSQDSTSSGSSGDCFQQNRRQKRDRSKSLDHTASSVKKRDSLSLENIGSSASGNNTPPITRTDYTPQKIEQNKTLPTKNEKKPSPRERIRLSFSDGKSLPTSPVLTPQGSPTTVHQSSRSQSKSPRDDKGKEKEKVKNKDKKK